MDENDGFYLIFIIGFIIVLLVILYVIIQSIILAVSGSGNTINYFENLDITDDDLEKIKNEKMKRKKEKELKENFTAPRNKPRKGKGF